METSFAVRERFQTCHGFGETLRASLEAAPRLYKESIDELSSDNNLLHERDDFIDHAYRTKAIVERYAGDEVPDIVAHLALIHDVVGRMYEDSVASKSGKEDSIRLRRSLASSIVADILTQPGVEMNTTDSTNSYVLCVLGDTVELEAMAEQYREQIADSEEHSSFVEALKNHSDYQPIEPHVWLIESPQLDIDHLTETCESVNIEAIVIKAAEMLDNIIHPPKNERALLQDILEIETFHAPLCEVLGLSSLAMQLRSEARMRRLERAGHQDIVSRAKSLREIAVQAGLASILETVYGQPLEGGTINRDIVDDTKVVKMSRTDTTNHLLSRIKASGSLAEKLRRDPRLPMDLVGLTLVLENETEVGEIMADTLRVLDQNPLVTLEPAPSKDTPIYIQGDASYIKTVQGLTGTEHSNLVQVREADDGAYRVAKITCTVEHQLGLIPLEVQFMAHNDHYNGWLGTAAHIFHKHGGDISHGERIRLAKLLERINVRMTKIDKKGLYVNERSRPSGERFMRGLCEGLELA